MQQRLQLRLEIRRLTLVCHLDVDATGIRARREWAAACFPEGGTPGPGRLSQAVSTCCPDSGSRGATGIGVRSVGRNRLGSAAMRVSATRTLVLIPVAIALNIALGSTVQQALKLPTYPDSVGPAITGGRARPEKRQAGK